MCVSALSTGTHETRYFRYVPKSETLPVQQHAPMYESRSGILQLPRILTLVQLSYAPFHQNPTTPDDEICWNQV